MPNIKQLKNVLKNGNDDFDNRLILNKNGNFELIVLEGTIAYERFKDFDYVTRWETWDAGNGYVGEEAAKDDRHINNIFRWAQKAWRKYKSEGVTQITNLTS